MTYRPLQAIVVIVRDGLEYRLSPQPDHITPDDIDALLRCRRDWNRDHQDAELGVLPRAHVEALVNVKATVPGSEVIY